MNWVDIFKTLEIVRDNSFSNIYMFEETTTFTAPKTGYYKIICVGAGGTAYGVLGNSNTMVYSGGAGGVAMKTKRINKNSTIAVTISASGAASCDGMTANAGHRGYPNETTSGAGGTATGGEYNYTGNSGTKTTLHANGGSIGCIIPGIMYRDSIYLLSGDNEGKNAYSGWGILGHGGGAGVCGNAYSSSYPDIVIGAQQPAAVIIIPLPSLG